MAQTQTADQLLTGALAAAKAGRMDKLTSKLQKLVAQFNGPTSQPVQGARLDNGVIRRRSGTGTDLDSSNCLDGLTPRAVARHDRTNFDHDGRYVTRGKGAYVQDLLLTGGNLPDLAKQASSDTGSPYYGQYDSAFAKLRDHGPFVVRASVVTGRNSYVLKRNGDYVQLVFVG